MVKDTGFTVGVTDHVRSKPNGEKSINFSEDTNICFQHTYLKVRDIVVTLLVSNEDTSPLNAFACIN